MTPTVPDGPDTELAAAVARARAALAEWEHEDADVDVHLDPDTVRALLARPAVGRDLTVACDFSGGPFADCTLAVPRSELPGVLVTDVGDSRSAYVCIERNGETVYRYAGEASAGEWEHCPRVPADAHVEEDARPAVARTDGRPPVDDDVYEPLRAEIRAGEAAHDRRIGRPAAPADDTAAPDGPICAPLRCTQCGAALQVESYPSEHYDGDVITGIVCAAGCGASWEPDGGS